MKIRRSKGSRSSFQLSDYGIDPETHVVAVEGELDLYSAPALKHRMGELIDEGKTHIVLDLSQVIFIDSTTTAVLVGGRNRLRPAAGSLVLVATADNIVRLFRLTVLDRTFPLYQPWKTRSRVA